MQDFDWYAICMIVVFILGYFLITIEHITKINKTTVALLMAVICWALQFTDKGFTGPEKLGFLGSHLANISQVVFFLVGALCIVEIIDTHGGFRIISDRINIRSKRKLLWLTSLLAFFLSAILDNLTTTILMISLIRKMIDDGEDRLIIGGAVVIAANAGGAWTPIGDITTTMLWIGGQLTSGHIITSLFIPSLVCILVALAWLTFMLKGDFAPRDMHFEKKHLEPIGKLIFFLGIGSLIFVPIFKTITGLPPFMGVLFGMSILWLVTDIVHYKYPERSHLRVPYVLSRIDLSSVLFFLGILLCINALETAGILEELAHWLDRTIGNVYVIAAFIGLASAIVDNVPLVAAAMGMYSLEHYPVNSTFWTLVAYCAGTGGSILIIGSAAGIAFMGLEKVDFFWYVKRIGIPALLGYFAGMFIYLLL